MENEIDNNMAATEPRQLYINYFRDQLLKKTSKSEDTHMDQKRQLLCETITDGFEQALSAVEDRFGNYLKQLTSQHIDDMQLKKAKKLIISAEKSKTVLNMHGKTASSTSTHLHREALKNCFKSIREVLDLETSTVLDELISHDVLSVSDEESIRGRGNRKGQAEELLGCLVGSLTAEDFHRVLLPALEQKYPWVVENLLAEVDRLENEFEESVCIGCRVRRDVKVKRIATRLLTKKHISFVVYSDLRNPTIPSSTKWAELQSVPESAIIEAMEVKYPDMYRELKMLESPSLECRCLSAGGDEEEEQSDEDTIPDTSDTGYDMNTILVGNVPDLEGYGCDFASSFQENLISEYKMTASPRGICLIINNTEIKGHLKRFWSDRDKEKLERVFTKLDFRVIIRTNLKAKQMMTTMMEFAQMKHTYYDAFVCCILTQGKEAGLYGCDGNVIKDSKLTSPFKASSCPTLAGKPKMFFIQASRDDITKTLAGNGTPTADGYVADDADFLLGYCTSPSSQCFVTETGSWYVNALTETLDKYSDRYDLLSCMRLVNKKVAWKIAQMNNSWQKQVPSPVFTLTKELYLTTSPRWPHVPLE